MDQSNFASFCQELIEKKNQWDSSLHDCLIKADNATIHRTEEARSLLNTEFSTCTFRSSDSYIQAE